MSLFHPIVSPKSTSQPSRQKGDSSTYYGFNKVRNRIITVKNTRQNSLRKNKEFLNVRIQARQADLIPFPVSIG